MVRCERVGTGRDMGALQNDTPCRAKFSTLLRVVFPRRGTRPLGIDDGIRAARTADSASLLMESQRRVADGNTI
jgi:hypothetical protein